MSREAWSDQENELIVADYFAMLADDLAGRPYNKAQHNRSLQDKLDRERGAIERKHQNISAVLMGLGETWIPGYKPAFNFQMTLVEVVVRRLQSEQHRAARMPAARSAAGFGEETALWIGPPPGLRNNPPADEVEHMLAIAQRFNVAERDAANRALGRAGEERVIAHERRVLTGAGRPDLAHAVRWVSEVDGDGAGYDIASFTPAGQARLIEVKTTNGWERTPFHITRNELAVADDRRGEWCLVRLWNFAREPRAYELRPPLDAHVTLTATAFQASLP